MHLASAGGGWLTEYEETLPGAVVGLGAEMNVTIPMLGMPNPEYGCALHPDQPAYLYTDYSLSFDWRELDVWEEDPSTGARTWVNSGDVFSSEMGHVFIVEGNTPGPAQLSTRAVSPYFADDFATINVVQATIEINGEGEEDDIVGMGFATPAREFWEFRPEFPPGMLRPGG
ncbi:MAG: hypothetical protein AB1696_14870 [Planctomycetota bacterium]